MEIKHPFAHLVKQDTDSSVVMFEMDDIIYCWDDLAMNYPRWSFNSFDNKEQAIDRVKEMVEEEDWELLETSEEKLKTLVV